MQVALKLPVTAEAEPTDDADDRCGICLKACGHGAHAEEHEFARVLEDRPDDFLALDAELIDALSELRGGGLEPERAGAQILMEFDEILATEGAFAGPCRPSAVTWMIGAFSDENPRSATSAAITADAEEWRVA